MSQASIVSILQGAGLGGGAFLIAILLAFTLTFCYISTYSELSLMLPKAGSISTYTAVSIGHFAAIIAALAAYVAPAIFALGPGCGRRADTPRARELPMIDEGDRLNRFVRPAVTRTLA